MPSLLSRQSAVTHERKLPWIILTLTLILAAIGLRTLNLDADPVPWYTVDMGYQIDEGYKTLSPRNLHTFNTTHWNSADEYKGWMNNSPMTQWAYYYAFDQFGVELSSARLVSVFYTLLLLGCCTTFLFATLPPRIACLGIALLALDPGIFLFSRSALFEISLTLLTYVSIFIAAKIPERKHYLSAVVLLACGIAGTFLAKETTIVYIAPALLAVLLLATLPKLSRNFHWMYLVVLAVGVLAVGYIAYLTYGTWAHRLAIAQLTKYPQSILLNNLHTITPFAIPLAYVVIIDFCLRRPEELFLNRYRLFLAAIAISVPIAFSLFRTPTTRYLIPAIPAALLLVPEWFASLQATRAAKHNVPRALSLGVALLVFLALTMHVLAGVEYHVVRHLPIKFGGDQGISVPGLMLLYPFCLLLFAAFCYLLLKPRWSQYARPVVVTLCALHIIAGAAIAYVTLANPSYASRNIEKKIIATIGLDKSVGGDWAPFFTKESRMHSLYMRPDFNNADYVTSIRPDYFLYSDTWYDQQTIDGLKANPDIVLGDAIPLGQFVKKNLLLYPITYKVLPQQQ